MRELLRALRQRSSTTGNTHCLLEMPSGTGKTIALLSLITSWQHAAEEQCKLIYCTRTVPEMEKVLEELKGLVQYRKKHTAEGKIVALGLSARKNLCIHPRVSIQYEGSKVDSMCRSLTAEWVREEARHQREVFGGDAIPADQEIELCDFYEEFERSGISSILPNGVYTLQDLKRFGKKYGWCPYFLARRSIEYANVIVYNYSYLLDPKIANLVSRHLTRDCIVVFDEAHNIDNVCIEALSVNVNQQTISGSLSNIRTLHRSISDLKEKNAQRLKDEYQKLVGGLAAAGVGKSDQIVANPVLPADILQETVPGNIRKGEHFLTLLRRFVEYVRQRLDINKVITEDPNTFLSTLQNKTQITPKVLRFCSDRLTSLFNTLEVRDIFEYLPLRVIADFATLAGTYQDGFVIVIEPYDERTPYIPDPVLQFSCMDASIAIKPVLEKFGTVIITSGTLSPLDFYPKLLNFTPTISRSLPMTLTRNCICPLVTSRGSDQVSISTTYRVRNDIAVVRNYGNLLLSLAQVVPDGIICFFTSYQYMEDIVNQWHSELGILDSITKHKLIFIETPNTAETSIALDNYRKACDSGRGAIFMSIARGKVAEGIDFDGHYGRAVIMFGVPYVNTESRILKARLDYLQKKFHISESDFLTFDALRHAAQCIGRVIRNKVDYGLMVLADKRYNRLDRRKKLPSWILKHLTDERLNLSVDATISMSKKFLLEMSHDHGHGIEVGKTLYTKDIIERKQHHGSTLDGQNLMDLDQ